jgi:16S rRNA (guanine527-N7)-methyltransferase
MHPMLESSDVSRETMERLAAYHDHVVKWTSRINLVSNHSIPDLWERHIWDSAQIVGFCKTARLWVDVGSGGGFPGLVVAILAKEQMPDRETVLIESDVRKSTFLRTVIRDLDLNARVIIARIEDAPPQNAEVISARALADLAQLLSYAERHLAPGGTCLLMKGESWEKEVQKASQSWSFDLRAHRSKTNSKAAILEIKDISRV